MNQYLLKKLLWIVVLLGLAVGLSYIVKVPTRNPAAAPATGCAQPITSVVTKDYVKYSGRDGQTAFALLQAAAPVEFKQYDFGVFVQSINHVTPDKNHFWKLYVNGRESQVGADAVHTANCDIIEWKLEAINKNS